MDSTLSTAWLEPPGAPQLPLAGNCAIGRASTCQVVIPHVKASRLHATIHAQDGGEFWLIDLGSTNGTLLNGRRVVLPVCLHDGDRVTIAETTLIFRQRIATDSHLVAEAQATLIDVRPEKRWLLLADIEGFTPLSQQLPPEELATVVGRWVRRGREIIEGNGGTLYKYLGDGYLAGWIARPDTVAQVAAAVTAFRSQWETAQPKFRIVIHYGTLSIGGSAGASFGEESLLGPELNFLFRAEKVASAAGAHFCFTSAARKALGEALPLEPIPGRHEMKGFPNSYQFFRLC